MIGQLINAGAQIASQKIASDTARKNTDLTNKANRELAEYQYQKNLENWHLQNEYNTPAKQMERFKEAGLNPHLVYSQGNPGNAAQIGQYQAPRMEYNYKPSLDPLAIIGAFQNFQLQRAQIDNVRADTEIKEATASYKQQGLQDMLSILASKNLITDQQREKLATELGWFNAPTTDQGWKPKTRGQELLESQLNMKQEGVRRLKQDTSRLFYDTKMKEYMSNWYDVNFWSKLAQGFGLKLPTLNMKSGSFRNRK